MNKTEVQSILKSLRILAFENFLDWAKRTGKQDEDCFVERISRLVDDWNLLCEETGCGDEIYKLQDDLSFTELLNSKIAPDIDTLCKMRLDSAEYVWKVGKSLKEVNFVVFFDSIEKDFDSIFYIMLAHPDKWCKSYMWEICFPLEYIELLAN